MVNQRRGNAGIAEECADLRWQRAVRIQLSRFGERFDPLEQFDRGLRMAEEIAKGLYGRQDRRRLPFDERGLGGARMRQVK